jgi:hypothetical protein
MEAMLIAASSGPIFTNQTSLVLFKIDKKDPMETDQSLLSETQRKKQQTLYQICSEIQVREDSQTTPQRPDVYEEKRKERETREMGELRQRTLNDTRSERRRMVL